MSTESESNPWQPKSSPRLAPNTIDQPLIGESPSCGFDVLAEPSVKMKNRPEVPEDSTEVSLSKCITLPDAVCQRDHLQLLKRGSSMVDATESGFARVRSTSPGPGAGGSKTGWPAAQDQREPGRKGEGEQRTRKGEKREKMQTAGEGDRLLHCMLDRFRSLLRAYL